MNDFYGKIIKEVYQCYFDENLEVVQILNRYKNDRIDHILWSINRYEESCTFRIRKYNSRRLLKYKYIINNIDKYKKSRFMIINKVIESLLLIIYFNLHDINCPVITSVFEEEDINDVVVMYNTSLSLQEFSKKFRKIFLETHENRENRDIDFVQRCINYIKGLDQVNIDSQQILDTIKYSQYLLPTLRRPGIKDIEEYCEIELPKTENLFYLIKNYSLINGKIVYSEDVKIAIEKIMLKKSIYDLEDPSFVLKDFVVLGKSKRDIKEFLFSFYNDSQK